MSDDTKKTETDDTKAPEAAAAPPVVEAELEPEPEHAAAPAAAPADGVIRDAQGNAIRHLRADEVARMNELARKA